ncbi:MAG: pyridoxal phosphate-dependent aminotransferase, partial [Vicinamibacterales bacterium]
LHQNALAEARTRLHRENRPYIDLTESNPTRVELLYAEDLLAPLAHSRGLAYMPEAMGALAARKAVADDLARRHIVVSPERVMLTVSTSDAYSVLFKLLCDPGDEVLIPQPSYPLFEHLTSLDSVVGVPYQLEYHGRWSINLASVHEALTPRTRAMLLVNPNNPTGSFVTPSELDALADLCVARDIALIADEVFSDYRLTDDLDGHVASLAGRDDVLGFSLGGLSKSVGLPQVKLAWTAISGQDGRVEQALGRLELICDTYLSVSTPVQLALGELLERGANVRTQIQARIKRNLARCAALVSERPSCTLLHPDGGWSAVIRVPRLAPEEELVLSLLVDAGVLVHPGYFFDFPDESYLVVSLLVPEAAFAEGVRRVLDRSAAGDRA